ncbi:acyl-CoA dehydrogenase family protein [Rhizobium puerariae]|uniref:Acyl-CoA dehydrogenase family protein n=1 Tax=Rhizobium puerariae TaxID=1585791 RepID=A0ABV6AG98_9HYPH
MTSYIHLLKRLEQVAPDIAADANEGAGRHEGIRLLRGTGVPSALIPTAFGGGGLKFSEASALLERVAAIDGSLGLILAMHFIHGTRFFNRENMPDPMAATARRLAASNGLINFVSSEGPSGAPSRGGLPASVARRLEDGGWRLSGRKSYVTGSSYLEAALVSARIEPAEPEQGPRVGVFLLPLPHPGAWIDQNWEAFGMSASASHDLVLEDVVLPADAYLETIENGGLDKNSHLFGILWSTMLASVHCGLATGARALALDYAKRPRLDGGEGTFAVLPRIQDAAARMELALLTARAALDRALLISEERADAEASMLASATRVIVHNEASRAVDYATQIVGGASVRLEHPIQRHYRDLRVAYFNPPNPDVILNGLARKILGLDKEDGRP